jgi:PKD repeat protein
LQLHRYHAHGLEAYAARSSPRPPPSIRPSRKAFGGSLVLVVLAVAVVLWTGWLGGGPGTGPAGPVARSTLAGTGFPTSIQHVVVIYEENQALATVLNGAPYEASLWNTYAHDSLYYAPCHPSAPEYLSGTSGQTLQCGSDSYTTYSVNNVANLMNTKGVSWKGYLESMPSPCDTSNTALYAVRHNPFPYYTDLGSSCAANDLPLSDWNPSSSTQPAFIYIAPNVNDDAHSAPLSQADAWLKVFLNGGTYTNNGGTLSNWPGILTQPWYSSTVIFITYDEGAYTYSGTVGYTPSGYSGNGATYCKAQGASTTICGNNVYFVAVSPFTRGLGDLKAYATHFSMLSTVEWLLGLPCTGSGYDCSSSFPALKGLFNFGSSAPLTVGASASPTTGTAPLTVQFTSTASGGTSPYTDAWTFGDGTSSSAPNPSHTYSTTGNFTAKLTVTDSAGHTASASLAITVSSAGTPLSVTASANVTTGTAPLAVQFRATARGGTSPYTYAWTFGDGASSSAQNPTHTYSAAGSYTATVSVTDSQSNHVSQSIAISVTAPAGPTVAISANVTSGAAPLDVGFQSTVTGGITPYAYHWNFGDGTSSTATNPSHTFSTAGNFTAKLTVTDSTGQTGSATLAIRVSSAGTPLAVTASANVTSGTVPLAVGFSSSPTGGSGAYSYHWTFGDGGTSTKNDPSHTYSSAGTYAANVTVTDSKGHTAGATVAISAGPAPLAVSISATLPSAGSPLLYNFSAHAKGGTKPYSYLWQIAGLAAPLTGENVSYQFRGPGTYAVTAVVTDATNRSANATVNVTVEAPLRVQIGALTATGSPTVGEPIRLNASPTGGDGPYTYSWALNGSRVQADGSSLTWFISGPGVYTFSVTVTDVDGEAATNSTVISVLPAPPGSGGGPGASILGLSPGRLATILVGTLLAIVGTLSALYAMSWRDLHAFEKALAEGRYGPLSPRSAFDRAYYSER